MRLLSRHCLLQIVLSVAVFTLIVGCDEEFSGPSDNNKGFTGTDSHRDSQNLDIGVQTGDGNQYSSSGWPSNPQGRQDVEVEYGDDDQSLFVPAQIFYNGDHSGADALFTFYMQRTTPAPMRTMKEVIQAQGEKVSSTNTVEKFCRCGQSNEFLFYWAHKNGRKGALHSPVYNQDPRLMGDWIIGNHVTGDGAKDWYKGNLTGAPQGPASFFFGADTENPTSMMGVNKEGVGFLRTWFYHPNSLAFFSTKDHVWHARDDMRIAITCQINQCPAELQQNTSITVRAHFSHSSQWLRP